MTLNERAPLRVHRCLMNAVNAIAHVSSLSLSGTLSRDWIAPRGFGSSSHLDCL